MTFIKSALREFVPHPVRLWRNVLQALDHGEPELHLLPALCKPGALSLDVGANRGVYAYLMRTYSAGVIAFDPLPSHATFARKALGNVKVIECALSEFAGKTVLRVPVEQNYSGMGTIDAENHLPGKETREYEVSVLTIDGLDLPDVGFIKIDVEGHELAVLRGAERVIRENRPNLLIEAEERHRQDATASVMKFLSQYGYLGLFLYDGVIRPIDQFDACAHQSQTRARDLTTPYINNFIFVQPDQLDALRAKAGAPIEKPPLVWPRRAKLV